MTEPQVINILSSSSKPGSSKGAREEDEDAPLIISLDIGDYVIHQILANTRNATNVLF